VNARTELLGFLVALSVISAACPTTSDDDEAGDDDSSTDDVGAGTAWAYHEVEMGFEATGGAGDGQAVIHATATFYDEYDERICEKAIDISGEYTHGGSGDDQLFAYTDQLIVPTAFQETASDCAEDFEVSVGDLESAWDWTLLPLAFVSCAAVESHPELASMQLVEPYALDLETWVDGTFEYFCDELGPVAAYVHGLDGVEAIWLRPCSPGEFDDPQSPLQYEYLVPEDTGSTEAWAVVQPVDFVAKFQGLSQSDEGNLHGSDDGER